ncbi:MAG: diphthine--ammonia ligase [Candidatus Omnitrophota bacterium]
MEKVFVSWSAGKDSCLSLFRVKDKYELSYLINMVNESGTHSRSHNIDVCLIEQQAVSMGIPLIQKKTSWETYEAVYKQTLLGLKDEGIAAGVFGDIDMQAHRDWVEQTSAHAGMQAILPLWLGEREALAREFIEAGFKAVVVAVNEKFLGPQWLGRTIDEQFLADLKQLGTVDLCGEKGEYHTFVYDGPGFKQPVDFTQGKVSAHSGCLFMELIPADKEIVQCKEY